MKYKNKKILLFDLDNTLADSKQPLDPEMINVLLRILQNKYIGIISGGKLSQLTTQVIDRIKNTNNTKELIEKIYLFPTCGASFYKYINNEWQNIYEQKFSEEDAIKIINALKVIVKKYPQEKVYGEQIENRHSQISMSLLGQEAPIEAKKIFDPDQSKRQIMKQELLELIPEFDIKIGGASTIDITIKGIDKAFAVEKIETLLGFQKAEMLFFGDAIFPGGNDYSVEQCGVECIKVKNWQNTLEILKEDIL